MIKAKLHIGHQIMSICTIHVCNVFSGKKKSIQSSQEIFNQDFAISKRFTGSLLTCGQKSLFTENLHSLSPIYLVLPYDLALPTGTSFEHVILVLWKFLLVLCM